MELVVDGGGFITEIGNKFEENYWREKITILEWIITEILVFICGKS
jgi:hypothetical protein